MVRGAAAARIDPRGQRIRNGALMSVVAFVVLTVALFALLGLVQKLVERL